MSYIVDVWNSPGTKGALAGGVLGQVFTAAFPYDYNLMAFPIAMAIALLFVIAMYHLVGKPQERKRIEREKIVRNIIETSRKGTNQQTAEKIIRGIELAPSRQALADKIIARIAEAEAGGEVTQHNNPETYAAIMKRLGILKAMIKAQKAEDDAHRASSVADDDLIMAEAMNIVPESMDNDSPKALSGSSPAIPLSDPDEPFHKAVSEQNRMVILAGPSPIVTTGPIMPPGFVHMGCGRYELRVDTLKSIDYTDTTNNEGEHHA